MVFTLQKFVWVSYCFATRSMQDRINLHDLSASTSQIMLCTNEALTSLLSCYRYVCISSEYAYIANYAVQNLRPSVRIRFRVTHSFCKWNFFLLILKPMSIPSLHNVNKIDTEFGDRVCLSAYPCLRMLHVLYYLTNFEWIWNCRYERYKCNRYYAYTNSSNLPGDQKLK